MLAFKLVLNRSQVLDGQKNDLESLGKARSVKTIIMSLLVLPGKTSPKKCTTSGKKMFQAAFGVTTGANSEYWNVGGFIDTSSVISSVEFKINAGTFDSGSIVVMAAV